MKRTRAEKNKLLLRYGVCALIGFAIGALVAVYQGFAFGQSAYLTARHLSDGFFVAGFLLASIGALIYVSAKTDFFDIFSYGVKSLLVLFTALRKPSEHISYYEYKEKKNAGRKTADACVLLTGVGFLLVSAICLILYYRLPR